MKEKIVIIGLGYIGLKIYEFFKKHDYDVYRFDINSDKSDFQKIEELNAHNFDFAFICVPTQMKGDGSCDTSLVEDSVKKVRAKTIIIQSTVVPGTTRKLEQETGKDLLFVPEYFGETKNHPLNDLDSRTFFIIGGKKEIRQRLVNLYKNIFDSKQVHFGFFDSTAAEIIKYMDNSYLAMKVVFCEEFFKICQAFGENYDEVREGWLLDPRINPSHTFARKDGLPGFGGKCYPKDVSAIIEASKKSGYTPEFLEAMLNYNKKFRNEK